jgi:hypothetical protein
MRQDFEGHLDSGYDDVGALAQRGAEHRVDLMVEDESAWESRRLHTFEARMESWTRSTRHQRGTRLS